MVKERNNEYPARLGQLTGQGSAEGQDERVGKEEK